MYKKVNYKTNYSRTRAETGFINLSDSSTGTYGELGFKSGLEVHQQLKTKEKLFCRCPSGIYQKGNEFDAEIVRHMRPTLSELGEYDGTALMEFKTKKKITYRIMNRSACTYEIDDTPPFLINDEALGIAVQIALMLNTNIVGELHITRKQYLDGSIPTGFQRTAIVGIEGKIPLSKKKIGVIQLSIEEDSCREVSDIGHERIYTTDRLGIPLIETVTYPDMKTPDEVYEAAQYIRYLTRSSGLVRTGIGAAREDVNVSIRGGTRVEIKGVAHIKWIPALTHIEAFRQKSLLIIRDKLAAKKRSGEKIEFKKIKLKGDETEYTRKLVRDYPEENYEFYAIRLPNFRGILSGFTQPGKTFADEISDRIKVIACIGKPNMIHTESPDTVISEEEVRNIIKLTDADIDDAAIIIWGPGDDIDEAVSTVIERCELAFDGVPNETRKALGSKGTTAFERVLPGPDRMYPDTDSAPIAIKDERIEKIRISLPLAVNKRERCMKQWKIPEDTFPYIHRKNLFPVIKKIVEELNYSPSFTGTIFGHRLKRLEGISKPATGFSFQKVVALFKFVKDRKLEKEIIFKMLPVIYEHPNMDFESVLTTVKYKKIKTKEIESSIPLLMEKFLQISKVKDERAKINWTMGQLRNSVIGNIPLSELYLKVSGAENG